MKNGKYPLLIWVLLTLFLLSIVNVFAHPGSLDSNGGHWDRKNGTYHFHEGKNTSGTSTSNPNYEYPYADFEPPYEPPTDNPYKNNKDAETISDTGTDIKEMLKNILAAVVCIWYVGVFIFWDFEKSDGCLTFGVSAILLVCLIGHLIEEKTELFFGSILIVVIFIPVVLKLKKKYTSALADIDTYLNSFYQLDKYYKELFRIDMQIESYKTFRIPDLYEIGTDGLPKNKNSSLHWGKSFTLYKTNNGTKMHAKYNCCSATNPLHIYRCRNYRDFSNLLCKKCANDYTVPDMSWYENYLKYEQAKSELKRINDNCDNLQKEIRELHKKCNSTKTKILIIFSKKNKQALQEANNKFAEIQADKQLSLFDYMENEKEV